MISALNHLQPLSGNKKWLFSIVAFLLLSCGSVSTSISKERNGNTEENSEKNVGVAVATDNNLSSNKETKLAKKETIAVSFRDQIVRIPNIQIVADETYRIVFALPFCFGKGDKTSEKLRDIMMEYFEGAELAIKYLQEQGYTIEVDVFDTKNDAEETRKLTLNPVFAQAHLIIGPVFENEFEVMEKFCSVYQIPIVNPLKQYEKKSKTAVPIFNPVVVDSTKHYHAAIQLIKHYSDKNFILLNDQSKEGFEIRKAFMKAFNFKHKSLPYVQLNELEPYLSNSTQNIVIIAPVSTEKLVRDLLNKTAGHKHIAVVGLEEWFDFPIIPFSTWEKNNLIFYNTHFINPQLNDIQLINTWYHELFIGTPGRYTYIGYDQVHFFAEALCTFGMNFGSFLAGYNFPLLHNSFNFHGSANDVFNNTMVNILELIDFELFKVN